MASQALGGSITAGVGMRAVTRRSPGAAVDFCRCRNTLVLERGQRLHLLSPEV